MNDNYILGWIKLYRSIRNHWIWTDANKLKWWIDILLEVNHSGKKVNIGFDIIECKRGQSVMSLQNWSERWNITKSKTKRFFDLLVKDEMITTENLIKTTRITVCNYDDYNNTRNGNETQVKRKRNASETETKTNNNEKKEIKIRKKIIVYLNSVLKTSYKPNTKKTVDVISSRINEGFTVEDFKKVIDIKYKEWHNNSEMSIYLRPETLFGNKFEGYLNQKDESNKDLSKLKKHVPKIKIG